MGNPSKQGVKDLFIPGVLEDERPEFDAWFGGSRVCDEGGAPLLLFHGTAHGGFARFAETGGKRRGDAGIFATNDWRIARTYARPKDAGLASALGYPVESERYIGDFDLKDNYTAAELVELYGFKIIAEANKVVAHTRYGNLIGVFDDVDAAVAASNERIARYPRTEGNRIGVYSLYMSLRNPLLIDAGGCLWRDLDEYGTTDKAAIQARANGYDGVIIRNVIDSAQAAHDDPSDIYVAFHPDQVRIMGKNRLEQSLRQDEKSKLEAQSRKADRAKKIIANAQNLLSEPQQKLLDLIHEKKEPGTVIRRDIVSVIKSMTADDLVATLREYEAKAVPVAAKQPPAPAVPRSSNSAVAPAHAHATDTTIGGGLAEWFKGSVVTTKGDDGATVPLRLFHGTTFDFEEYRLGRGARGQARDTKGALFFTSSPVAAAYHTRVNKGVDRGENPAGANIRPVFIRMTNPGVVDAAGGYKNPDRVADWIKWAKEDGKDGLIIKNVIDAEIGTAADVYVIFDPAAVRSAIGHKPVPFSFGESMVTTPGASALREACGLDGTPPSAASSSTSEANEPESKAKARRRRPLP